MYNMGHSIRNVTGAVSCTVKAAAREEGGQANNRHADSETPPLAFIKEEEPLWYRVP